MSAVPVTGYEISPPRCSVVDRIYSPVVSPVGRLVGDTVSRINGLFQGSRATRGSTSSIGKSHGVSARGLAREVLDFATRKKWGRQFDALLPPLPRALSSALYARSFSFSLARPDLLIFLAQLAAVRGRWRVLRDARISGKMRAMVVEF